MANKLYDLFGLDEGCTDEELDAAYGRLRSKYAEDRFLEGEAGNIAAKKLTELDNAYRDIVAQRREASNASAGTQNNAFKSVEDKIRSGDLAGAQNELDGFNERNAEWHYLYGIVCFRGGDYSSARNYLDRAVSMEPGNAEYRRARDSLNARSTRSYHTYDNGDTGATVNTACNCCSTLLCADSCCECMGGDLIPCC